MSTWIADAGPLIFLAKLGRLDLLRQAGNVYVPAAVLSEVQQYSDEAAAAIQKATQSWLQVREVGNKEAVRLLVVDLGPGEAEVITLASELGADWLVLDDLDARRFARRVGYATVGTIGLLLSARLNGAIPSLRAEIDRLREHGFWVSQALIDRALQTAGELD